MTLNCPFGSFSMTSPSYPVVLIHISVILIRDSTLIGIGLWYFQFDIVCILHFKIDVTYSLVLWSVMRLYDVWVIFKDIYYCFTKFIEHEMFSLITYITLFKNMPGGLMYFSSYLDLNSWNTALFDSPSMVEFRLSPRTCSLCGSVASIDIAHLFLSLRAYDVSFDYMKLYLNRNTVNVFFYWI